MWGLFLQEHGYTIQYRRGRLHWDADLLDGNPNEKDTEADGYYILLQKFLADTKKK